jgi:hypothetical protein
LKSPNAERGQVIADLQVDHPITTAEADPDLLSGSALWLGPNESFFQEKLQVQKEHSNDLNWTSCRCAPTELE